MMRWEQKYLEESAMRQFAMEAAATAAAQRYIQKYTYAYTEIYLSNYTGMQTHVISMSHTDVFEKVVFIQTESYYAVL